VTHPRSSWQSGAYPVTGPGSQPAKWTMTTLHWPGGTINPNDPGGTLRAWQSAWVNSKGYSLGYNFCVFPDGSQWEVRGFDIACAANGNQSVNVPAIAINLCVPDVNSVPSAAMVEGVVDLIEQTRQRQPAAGTINGHRDVRPEPTSCPGDVIYQWIAAGIFEPAGGPPPTPGGDDDDMAYGPYLIQSTGKSGDRAGTVYACDRQYMTIRALSDEEALAGYRWQLRNAGARAPELEDGAPIMPVDDLDAFGIVIS
jgi:hypothetical protein